MFRSVLCASFMGLAALLFAQQSPTPITDNLDRGAINPVDKTPLPPCACTVSPECVCPVFPVFQDDAGINILYYSEICSPAPTCNVDDVAYYWASDLAWPLECNSNNPSGCEDCEDATKNKVRQTRKVDSSTPFAGMTTRKSKLDTARDQLFPERVYWNGDNDVASPRNGIKAEYTKDFYVKFRYGADMIYIKLLIVRVSATASVHAPILNQKERFVNIGYQVGDLSAREKDDALLIDPPVNAVRKMDGGSQAQSDFVRSVSVLKTKFLVLLAQGT